MTPNREIECIYHAEAVDIDPTGGDPFMGGPVRITVCGRCGRELPLSDDAKNWNAAHPWAPPIDRRSNS